MTVVKSRAKLADWFFVEVMEFFGSKTPGFGDDRKVVAADLE
jgi:hypothetical protein